MVEEAEVVPVIQPPRRPVSATVSVAPDEEATPQPPTETATLSSRPRAAPRGTETPRGASTDAVTPETVQAPSPIGM